jgi:tetratricopeptide (TPR) repeat protein
MHRILSSLAACALTAHAGGALQAGATGVADRAAQEPPVTFTQHVAPIIFDACATCHRSGGAAPFSLLTYGEVRSRAGQIVDVTRRRLMPPWKPERGHGEFVGERRLTEAQIALLQAWLARGAIEGDPNLLPPPPAWSSEWQLGEPDLVLEPAPYSLRAGGADVYRNFVLPIATPTPRYIKAWQFLPGGSHALHHATMQFDATGASRRLDALDPEPGYEGLIPHTVQSPDGYFLGWTPGQLAYVAPEGMAWPVQPGTDLVMMLHLRPHGAQEQVRPRIGLYVTDAPSSRIPTMIRLTRQDLDIPAGSRRYRVADSFRLDVDVDAYAVQPHAHYLAREVKAFATRPDGTTEPLIYIRDWDFNWQDVYHYRRPIALPAGTTIQMEYVYDNSSQNARNPHAPPRRVTYGQRTTDEMAELWLQVVARSSSDRRTLARAVESKIVREEIVGREKMLEADPASTSLHDDVALLYVAIGALDQAARHFAETVRLDARSPAAHYNYGNVLLAQGEWEKAADHLARALALKPDYGLAHGGLGRLRRAQGRRAEAIQHLDDAVRFDPGDADAHHQLAAVLRLEGRLEEALPHYRHAVRIDPANAQARAELADLEQALLRINRP